MQVFSKIKPAEHVTWNQFYKNNVNLRKYTIPELKDILRANKLHVTGKKQWLIERITNYFNKVRITVKIQSYYRRNLVYKIIKLKGPGLKDRKLCVNDTDFFSLEPLENIEFNDFFSYTDEKDFTYGFDINSLLILMKKPGNVKNPYNRCNFSHNVIMDITTTSKLQKYLYPRKRALSIEQNNIREDMIEKMKIIRLLDHNDRINKLFYEIDLLGNYTSPSWLLDLSINSYLNLVRYIYEFWNSIPSVTKRKICPYFNPFQEGLQNINFGIRENIENIDYVKRACITVMENLIYTGINNEYKQIGTMHVLRGLTMVSNEARANLPWLYESIDI